MTFYIFGYGLGWYPKKALYLFIHIIIGFATFLSILLPVVFGLELAWIITGAVFSALLVGSYIEWTQNDYSGKEWADRKVWLLGSIRDVLFYPIGACLLYLLLLIK
jgi:hypothetical protein